ncbi:MAG TPA: hypothetical protein VFG33_19725 [Kribbella sp.]|uniref:hypothetical protein n=1 Tax=Kribbella sp. TaxID=1871183 RepID=UPI002D79A828|nr:hypothetical protein [Kribbella sp.]HET6295628.1 hypothetical protein [Kribbella sp.]
MTPWGSREVRQYVDALRAEQKFKAADYIERVEGQRGELGRDSLLSFPLWLSMVAFLSERVDMEVSDFDTEGVGDYSLLLACGQAVAREECHRHHIESEREAERLKGVWAEMAWVLHKALRSGGGLLHIVELLGLSGVSMEDPLHGPARSMLMLQEDRVVGFVHEVFLEFWLAQRILESLTGPDINTELVATFLSFQRSPVTNRLIRHGIRRARVGSRAAAAMRDSYVEVADSDVFTKNQLVYLLGRIDGSHDTLSFLRDRWRDENEADFVRYSAAFAGVIAGDEAMEAEFYSRLDGDDVFDRINRGYHRYYYGDLSGREDSLPFFDDGSGSASGAMYQLLQRLSRKGSHHIRSRRIELLTLRRFFETRPVADFDFDELEIVLQSVGVEEGGSQEFRAGVQREVGLLRRSIAR